MKTIVDIEYFECLTPDELSNAAVDLLSAGEQIHGFENPIKSIDEPLRNSCDNDVCMVLKHPVLAVGLVMIARLEKLHIDYLIESNQTNQLLQMVGETQKVIAEKLGDVAESLDFIAAESNCNVNDQINSELWKVSNLAAKDKASELGINIPPEWSMADLRYKINQHLNGG